MDYHYKKPLSDFFYKTPCGVKRSAMGCAMGITPSKGGAMGSCYGRRTAFYRPHPVATLWLSYGRADNGGVTRLHSIDQRTARPYAPTHSVL